ncbi:hypothetical protein T492DRAFT_833949 [Pavlovales sp. CCMP2436]|nr:hypothetical protein T492DRAFT_833949 [Pavlovales sp. CCMP2436]
MGGSPRVAAPQGTKRPSAQSTVGGAPGLSMLNAAALSAAFRPTALLAQNLEPPAELEPLPTRSAASRGLTGSLFHIPTPQMHSYAFPPWWHGAHGWKLAASEPQKPPPLAQSARGPQKPPPPPAPAPTPAARAQAEYAADSASFARAARRYGTRTSEAGAPSRAIAAGAVRAAASGSDSGAKTARE